MKMEMVMAEEACDRQWAETWGKGHEANSRRQPRHDGRWGRPANTHSSDEGRANG
jgi:hypothetical protein